MRRQTTEIEQMIERAVAGDTHAWAYLRSGGILSVGIRAPALVAAVVDAGSRLGWTAERSLRRLTVIDDTVCIGARAAVALVLDRCPEASLLPVTVTAKGARLRAQRSSGDPWSEFSYSALEAHNAGLTVQRRWRQAAGEICWERAIGRCCASLFADVFVDIPFDWEVRASRQWASNAQPGDVLPADLLCAAAVGSAA